MVVGYGGQGTFPSQVVGGMGTGAPGLRGLRLSATRQMLTQQVQEGFLLVLQLLNLVFQLLVARLQRRGFHGQPHCPFLLLVSALGGCYFVPLTSSRPAVFIFRGQLFLNALRTSWGGEKSLRGRGVQSFCPPLVLNGQFESFLDQLAPGGFDTVHFAGLSEDGRGAGQARRLTRRRGGWKVRKGGTGRQVAGVDAVHGRRRLQVGLTISQGGLRHVRLLLVQLLLLQLLLLLLGLVLVGIVEEGRDDVRGGRRATHLGLVSCHRVDHVGR